MSSDARVASERRKLLAVVAQPVEVEVAVRQARYVTSIWIGGAEEMEEGGSMPLFFNNLTPSRFHYV